jgi:protein-S-isoprenylcysteine O-methyltransferase Ste14
VNDSLSYIPVIIAIALFLARALELRAKRDVISGRVLENASFLIFVLIGIVMLFGSVTEYLISGRPFSWPFILGGLVVSFFSIWLRHRAIRALGKFWSLHVEIREEHEFIQFGPYSWVRHPTYLSMILELIAVALILKAIVMGIVIFLLFIPALVYRLRLEEAALVSKFGEAYREYCRRVPALIPYKPPRRIDEFS